MFGKHCSKRIESGVNRLHSSSLVAVRDLSTNPLLGVHDLQDVLRGHNLIHSVVHNSCLRLDSCRMSCLNQLLGWQWCLHNKRTGERDGCFSRSSFIQRLAKEAERRRTGGAEILFILFRAEKESCSLLSFTPSFSFTPGSDIWWNPRWERHEWKSFGEKHVGSKTTQHLMRPLFVL